MTNLVVRDNLFQDLFDFRRDFDQIFNRILLGKPMIGEQFVPNKDFEFLPEVESYLDKDGKKFICRVSLPGIDAKDVEIQAKGNLLTIKARGRSLARPRKST